MTMRAECPRCPGEIETGPGSWICPMHGSVTPLWRPESVEYDALADHLERSGSLPSWVPWPLPPGWSVVDFGSVGIDGDAVATVVTCSGLTDTDGTVSLTVVTEEPGTGLGARVARAVHEDPGEHTRGRPAQTRLRIAGAGVPLWMLPGADEGAAGSDQGDLWDRAVFVGEAQGRWVWLVASPASAALGLADWGRLEDLGDRGPELVALPFGPGADQW